MCYWGGGGAKLGKCKTGALQFRRVYYMHVANTQVSLRNLSHFHKTSFIQDRNVFIQAVFPVPVRSLQLSLDTYYMLLGK